MKVLLISANTEQISMVTMPLGMACVAEAAQNAGHDVSMLDLMFATDTEAQLKNVIADFSPQCIGISVRNIDDQNCEAPAFLLEKVKEVVIFCRDVSNSPIVLGGVGYSMFPESALDFLGADYGIEGEGETVFPAIDLFRDQSGSPRPSSIWQRHHSTGSWKPNSAGTKRSP